MRYFHKLFICIALTLMAATIHAQDSLDATGSIHGSVADQDHKPIPSASIQLLSATDSTLVKQVIADNNGTFQFQQLAMGTYLVKAMAVGHAAFFSQPIQLSANQLSMELKEMQLEPITKSMGAVVVTSKRPFIEQKAGKMVINVEASPVNAGLNALELLEKSPGVTVDNDGNISLKGKQGVLILIDGKPTYMSGADLAALLKSIQSTGLDQIEIMTNPPAKYDAAGNSGIINIKTKKGMVRGMNGNANGSYTQGLYARFNGGANVNYRNAKWNIFGGYNGGSYQGYNRLTIDRVLYESDKSTVARTIDQVSRPHFQGAYHGIKAGADYNFSKKDVLGLVLNANLNNNDEDPVSNSYIRDADGVINSNLRSNGNNERNSKNFSSNLNYKHSYDSTGREFTADLDFAKYRSRNNSLLATSSFDAAGQSSGPTVSLAGILPQNIDIYSAKVDYVHPLRKGWKLETGAKSSYVQTDNRVNYQRSSGGEWVADDRSNHFTYRENINAAYLIASGNIKKWELSAGLRAENTNASGKQERNDSSFRRNYTNLFPNVGVGYNMNEQNQFNLSYSRRVQRPNYDDLNPFVFFLDSLTYGQGNPYLQPQFTNNVEFSHTFHHLLTTTVNYTRTDDVITELLKQETTQNITYQTKENFSTMKQYGISMMANIPVQKWWNMNVYANVYYNSYEGIYQLERVKLEYTSFTANMSHNLNFGNGWNAEVSGWFRGKGLNGLLVTNNMGALNTGLSKQIMNKKGTLKLGIRDLFKTQVFSGKAVYSDVNVHLASRRDTRQLNLGFVYRFGKTNIAPERKRRSGADDEQSRVGGSN